MNPEMEHGHVDGGPAQDSLVWVYLSFPLATQEKKKLCGLSFKFTPKDGYPGKRLGLTSVRTVFPLPCSYPHHQALVTTWYHHASIRRHAQQLDQRSCSRLKGKMILNSRFDACSVFLDVSAIENSWYVMFYISCLIHNGISLVGADKNWNFSETNKKLAYCPNRQVSAPLVSCATRICVVCIVMYFIWSHVRLWAQKSSFILGRTFSPHSRVQWGLMEF